MLDGKMIRFSPLPWDTRFFGVKSARIDIFGCLRNEEFLQALSLTEGYPFVCIANRDSCISNAELIAANTGAFVADINIQLAKKLRGAQAEDLHSAGEIAEKEYSSGCFIYRGYAHDAAIVRIAEEVYSASRFIQDGRFAQRNGAKVYAEWAKNAFGNKDKYFVTHKGEDGKTDAFLLFSVETAVATVELVGVNGQTQHQGCGKRIWAAMEAALLPVGVSEIHVGTQVTNFTAMNFYASAGCRIVGCNQIYHWWKE